MKDIGVNLAAIVLLTLTFVGCQYDPSTRHYLETPPSEADIIGKYVLDVASRKRHIILPMSGTELRVDASAAIILSDDHSAQFVRVPAGSFEGRKPCAVTGRGSWGVNLSQGRYYVVSVRIHNEEKNSPCGSEYNWPLMLYGKEPPYKLHQIIDDPDLGEFVQFEKHGG